MVLRSTKMCQSSIQTMQLDMYGLTKQMHQVLYLHNGSYMFWQNNAILREQLGSFPSCFIVNTVCITHWHIGLYHMFPGEVFFFTLYLSNLYFILFYPYLSFPYLFYFLSWTWHRYCAHLTTTWFYTARSETTFPCKIISVNIHHIKKSF
jgi:hypothetical protein